MYAFRARFVAAFFLKNSPLVRVVQNQVRILSISSGTKRPIVFPLHKAIAVAICVSKQTSWDLRICMHVPLHILIKAAIIV